MEFRILGPLEVVADGRPVRLGTAKERAILAVLLLHAGEIVSRERLIDELWGESPPPTAAKAVNVYVSQLRKSLTVDDADSIVTRPGGYLIQVAPTALDAARFEALVAEARARITAGDVEAGAATLRQALALWRGQALAGIALESLGRSEVDRLEELRLAALLERIDCDLALGRHERVVAELEVLAAEHPLRERVRAQYMLALYRCGRQAEALQAYRDARETLVGELGIEPSAPLQQLEKAILNQDPALEAHGSADAAAPPPPMPVRHRRILLLGLAAVVAGGAAAGVIASRSHPAIHALARVAPNSVAVVDTKTDQVVAAVSVGGSIGGIATGDGGIWIGDYDANSLERIDPASAQIVRTTSLPARPTDVAFAAGSVWVSSSVGKTLLRVSPRYLTVEQQIPIRQTGGRFRAECCATENPVAWGDGSMWVAHDLATISRVDPKHGLVLKRLPTETPATALAFGAGRVWAMTVGINRLLAIDPVANAVDWTLPLGDTYGSTNGLPAPYAGRMTFAANSLWVAENGQGTVWRIDPVERRVTAIIRVGSGPTGIAYGQGSIWVANTLDRTISRINVRNNTVVATIHLGSEPRELVVSDGRVWATVY